MLAARQPKQFCHLEVEEHAHQVPPFMGAGDIARLVFDPHPAAALEAQGLGEVLAPLERRVGETMAVHGGDRRVEALHKADEIFICCPARHGAVIAVQEAPVPREGLGFPVLRGELHPSAVQGLYKNVVDVPLVNVRAAEGVGVIEIWRATATGADEAAGGLRHGKATPLRELNSLIISSQARSFSRSPDQNVGSRLATKSSIATPCCSTQVK